MKKKDELKEKLYREKFIIEKERKKERKKKIKCKKKIYFLRQRTLNKLMQKQKMKKMFCKKWSN